MSNSYAQLNQDLLASAFFKQYPPEQKNFLDVGAFDGISFSNTYLLFEQGWQGICVEPVLKNYRKLENLYKNSNVITVNAAATDYEGEMIMNVATIPWAQDWGSDVSSPSEDALIRWPDYVWEKETVQVTTVNKILEQNDIKHVDFVSIDVEGHEITVLRGFNLGKYQPCLLVVEYSTKTERLELIRYMKSQGYFIWMDNNQDIFFVRGQVLHYWKVLPYTIWSWLKIIGNLKSFIAGKIKRLLK